MHLPLRQLILLFILVVTPVAAQQNFQIAKIEFEGLNRLSAEDMIATTELKIGAPFSLAALDAAAQTAASSRMSATARVLPKIRSR